MTKEAKVLVFDMDGTIANLYAMEDWLPRLRAYDPTPYIQAAPMYDMEYLKELVLKLKAQGWLIVVTTALAMVTTPGYDALVTKAKRDWLKRYDFPYDLFFAVPYVAHKEDYTKSLGGRQILVDDNVDVRAAWTIGETINAKENILPKLESLLAA